jgi:hypothetical protein
VLGIVLGPVMFAIAASILDVLSDRTVLPTAGPEPVSRLPGDPYRRRDRHGPSGREF